MSPIADHPMRKALANELHARPFPNVPAPARAAFLAIKPAQDAVGRDRAADMAHLLALLDHYGAPHPKPDATHYSGPLGRFTLKWESHTEFVTFMIYGPGTAERPFDAATFAMFPDDWLAAAPGVRMTSALVRIEQADGDAGIYEKAQGWFVPESLAISRVLEDELVVAGDFRIDEAGHMRFAVFARSVAGSRRIGRVLQRLCEIETYKALSMLGLQRAQGMSAQMAQIDAQLTQVLADMAGPVGAPEDLLQQLLETSATLENLVAQSANRFGATKAYETIVNQRVEILREGRFEGLQTFAEFMMRRYDPAMRTVASTQARLAQMSARAQRAGDLLRTRVDVERSAQNQTLLASMDRRADLQLRLQETVEGLSIVAISYYAVNLVLNLAGPVYKAVGWGKVEAAALVTPFVLLAVWWMLRRIKRSMH